MYVYAIDLISDRFDLNKKLGSVHELSANGFVVFVWFFFFLFFQNTSMP